MGQAEVVERLYYVSDCTTADLSVILNLSENSVKNSIRRLKVIGFVELSDRRGYRLTSKGRLFAERYYI